MLYEERSQHQHHTIDNPTNVKDIVGPPRSSPLGGVSTRQAGAPRHRGSSLSRHPSARDRIVWDLINKFHPYSISLTTMDREANAASHRVPQPLVAGGGVEIEARRATQSARVPSVKRDLVAQVAD